MHILEITCLLIFIASTIYFAVMTFQTLKKIAERKAQYREILTSASLLIFSVIVCALILGTLK